MNIPLSNCSKPAMVDAEDYERLLPIHWRIYTAIDRRSHIYVVANHNGRSIQMHRYILFGDNSPKGISIVHKDNDPLNCRKSNLVQATRSQVVGHSKLSVANTSGYKGVWLSRYASAANPYAAEIRVNNEKVWLGYHATVEDAAQAYNEAASEYFGKAAVLNEIRK